MDSTTNLRVRYKKRVVVGVSDTGVWEVEIIKESEDHFGRLVPSSAWNQKVPSSNPGLSWLSLVVNCCALRTAHLHLRVANATAT